jgi:translation initiation factor IF-1
MPGKNNAAAAKGKGMNRKSQYAKAANDKVLTAMLVDGVDEESTRFGKVTKMVGNSRVEVALSDGRSTNALIRNVLRGKQATPIRIGTVALIGLPHWQKEAAGEVVDRPEAYIEAVLDRKTAKYFVSQNKMPASFLVDGEAGSDEGEAAFEFGSEDEEEEEKPKATAVAAPVGGAGATVATVAAVPAKKTNIVVAPEEEDIVGFSFE